MKTEQISELNVISNEKIREKMALATGILTQLPMGVISGARKGKHACSESGPVTLQGR